MSKYIDTGKKDTRSGFGAGLLEAGRKNPQVLALTADLKGSLKMDAFAAEFPDRFIQCGIAEANMVGAAAGLAIAGKIPFIGSFAEFVTGRVYDQLRQAVAYGKTNVKIASSHAGVTLGEDGATHQTMEDIALMRAIPGMVVINAADYNQTKAATIAAAEHFGPVYLRFGRLAVPVFHEEGMPFRIGKGELLRDGGDLAILATGLMSYEALKAAEALKEKGVDARVINLCTIKPLDEELVLKAAAECGRVITCEEHSVIGGLGEAVCALLSERCPTPVRRIGVQDEFGHSGPAAALLEQFGLCAAHIVEVARELCGV